MMKTTLKIWNPAALALCATGFAAPAAAVDYLLDQPTCEIVLAGSWFAGSSTCRVSDYFLAATDTLTVNIGTELSVNGTSQNQGMLSVFGELVNQGDLDNDGRVFIFADAEFRNYDAFTNGFGAVLSNLGSFSNIGGTIRNNGDMVNSGPNAILLNRNGSANIFNSGELVNAGDATLRIAQGVLDNNGTLNNDSSMEILSAAVFRNAVGARFTNRESGIVRNEGQMQNITGSQFNNEGGVVLNAQDFDNWDDATISNTLKGMLINFGVLRNGTAGVFSNRAQVFNNGQIHNYCMAELFNMNSGNIFNTPIGVLNNHSGTLVNQGAIFTPPVNNPCFNWP